MHVGDDEAARVRGEVGGAVEEAAEGWGVSGARNVEGVEEKRLGGGGEGAVGEGAGGQGSGGGSEMVEDGVFEFLGEKGNGYWRRGRIPKSYRRKKIFKYQVCRSGPSCYSRRCRKGLTVLEF